MADSTLVSLNRLTGQPLGEVPRTRPEDLPGVFATARAAQARWAELTPKKRAQSIYNLRETILNHRDDIAVLVTQETGKPIFESWSADIVPAVETLSYFARRAPKLLKDRTLWLGNPLLLHRKSYLSYAPLGVVAVISPWNFPFFLPLGEIVMALLAGNAVVFKPSEVTPLVGAKIQSLCDEAGLPKGILQTLQGDGTLGQALVEARPDKIFFTGSVATGKRIAQTAAQHLTPINLELGGKDAMIVLPDADLDYATSAALWGSFANSGQMCASTERILVHEEIADPFLKLFAEKTARLRQGVPVANSSDTSVDLGLITYEKQKPIYEKQLNEARNSEARFATGGEFTLDHRALKPTIVSGDVEKLAIYNEETFGPVVAVTRFRSPEEAIEKNNRSRYGLLASVIGRNIRLAEQIARRLDVGTVTINEVAYTASLPETPWGGIKDTGGGRKHSDLGFYEFTHARHIHKPRFGGHPKLSFFKSLWWYPYTPQQLLVFKSLLDVYRGSLFDKLRAIPHFLFNLVTFIKKDPRL